MSSILQAVTSALLILLQLLSVHSLQILENVALGQTATMSSWDYDGPPEKAVDGITEMNAIVSPCVHTESYDTQNWWKVQLAEAHEIVQINLYNRADHGNDIRLGCVEFRVGNSSTIIDNPICATWDVSTQGDFGPQMREFQCEPPITGSYVSVQRTCPGRDPNGQTVPGNFHFCELEAFVYIPISTIPASTHGQTTADITTQQPTTELLTSDAPTKEQAASKSPASNQPSSDSQVTVMEVTSNITSSANVSVDKPTKPVTTPTPTVQDKLQTSEVETPAFVSQTEQEETTLVQTEGATTTDQASTADTTPAKQSEKSAISSSVQYKVATTTTTTTTSVTTTKITITNTPTTKAITTGRDVMQLTTSNKNKPITTIEQEETSHYKIPSTAKTETMTQIMPKKTTITLEAEESNEEEYEYEYDDQTAEEKTGKVDMFSVWLGLGTFVGLMIISTPFLVMYIKKHIFRK